MLRASPAFCSTLNVTTAYQSLSSRKTSFKSLTEIELAVTLLFAITFTSKPAPATTRRGHDRNTAMIQISHTALLELRPCC